MWPDILENICNTFLHKEKIVQALWITHTTERTSPNKTQDGRIWSVNAELAGLDTLNNNAIIHVANDVAKHFLNQV